MEQPISVRFSYTPDDSLRVAKFIKSQSFIYRNDVRLTSGIVFVGFIVLIVLMADDVSAIRIIGATVFSAVPAIMVGLAVFVLHKVLNPWLMRRAIMKYFRSSPAVREETRLTFSDIGISAESELTSSLTKWPSVVKVVESDSDILFYSSHKPSWFVPKSAFSSLDDLASLKILLQESLNENAKLL